MHIRNLLAPGSPSPQACQHFYFMDGCLAQAMTSSECQLAEAMAFRWTEGRRAQRTPGSDLKPGHLHTKEIGSLYQIRNLNLALYYIMQKCGAFVPPPTLSEQ